MAAYKDIEKGSRLGYNITPKKKRQRSVQNQVDALEGTRQKAQRRKKNKVQRG
jgi:hypothetical protein